MIYNLKNFFNFTFQHFVFIKKCNQLAQSKKDFRNFNEMKASLLVLNVK